MQRVKVKPRVKLRKVDNEMKKLKTYGCSADKCVDRGIFNVDLFYLGREF